LLLTYHHSHFLATTLDFTSFFTMAFLGTAHFFYSWAVFGLDTLNAVNKSAQSPDMATTSGSPSTTTSTSSTQKTNAISKYLVEAKLHIQIIAYSVSNIEKRFFFSE